MPLRPEHVLPKAPQGDAIPLHAVASGDWDDWIGARPARWKAWAEAQGFKAASGAVLTLPGEDGGIEAAVLGVGKGEDRLVFGAGPEKLPARDYVLQGREPDAFAALGWALGAYAFDQLKPSKTRKPKARLATPEGAAREEAIRLAEGIYVARDLVNLPSNLMGPQELEDAARDLANRHGAVAMAIVGEGLLAENFPMIHAVGARARGHRG